MTKIIVVKILVTTIGIVCGKSLIQFSRLSEILEFLVGFLNKKSKDDEVYKEQCNYTRCYCDLAESARADKQAHFDDERSES